MVADDLAFRSLHYTKIWQMISITLHSGHVLLPASTHSAQNGNRRLRNVFLDFVLKHQNRHLLTDHNITTMTSTTAVVSPAPAQDYSNLMRPAPPKSATSTSTAPRDYNDPMRAAPTDSASTATHSTAGSTDTMSISSLSTVSNDSLADRMHAEHAATAPQYHYRVYTRAPRAPTGSTRREGKKSMVRRILGSCFGHDD
jgi:hypothetical protein